MPIAFQRDHALFDVTPVENLFIETCLADAPGDFVKVYLYVLMLCYHPESGAPELEDIAHALNLSVQQVRASLTYWEEKNLIVLENTSPLSLRVNILKQNLLQGVPSTAAVNGFSVLLEQVRTLFGGKRDLNNNEIKLLRDWYETYSLGADALSAILTDCLGRKGAKVSFQYVDSVIKGLAEKGLLSFEQINAYFCRRDAMNSGAARILTRWNVRRAPSQDELELYEKWTESWGFEEDGIIVACRQLTGASSPNFKYLDAVLLSIHGQGAHSAADVHATLVRSGEERAACVEIAQSLGMRGTLGTAPEMIALYRKLLAQGFSRQTILLAARTLARKGLSSPDQLESFLANWYESGIVSEEEAVALTRRRESAAAAVSQWLRLWGMQRAPADNEITAYEQFVHQWNLPEEIISLAARDAADAQYPLKYMSAILRGCRQNGILTTEKYETHRTAATTQQDAPVTDSGDDYTDIFALDYLP